MDQVLVNVHKLFKWLLWFSWMSQLNICTFLTGRIFLKTRSSSILGLPGHTLCATQTRYTDTEVRPFLKKSRPLFELHFFESSLYMNLTAFVALRWRHVYCLNKFCKSIALYFAQFSCIRKHFKLSIRVSEFSFRFPSNLSDFPSVYIINRYCKSSRLFASLHPAIPLVTALLNTDTQSNHADRTAALY